MAGVSSFSEEVAAAICERLMEGQSLRAICKAEDMPAMSTVFKWLAENESFSKQYARARDVQADTYADEVVEIADEVPVREQPDPDGGVTVCIDSAGVQRNKLRVDTRKWAAAKRAPKKYGDSSSLALTGANGGAIETKSLVTLEIDL